MTHRDRLALGATIVFAALAVEVVVALVLAFPRANAAARRECPDLPPGNESLWTRAFAVCDTRRGRWVLDCFGGGISNDDDLSMATCVRLWSGGGGNGGKSMPVVSGDTSFACYDYSRGMLRMCESNRGFTCVQGQCVLKEKRPPPSKTEQELIEQADKQRAKRYLNGLVVKCVLGLVLVALLLDLVLDAVRLFFNSPPPQSTSHVPVKK